MADNEKSKPIKEIERTAGIISNGETGDIQIGGCIKIIPTYQHPKGPPVPDPQPDPEE
jgi:hypothetical protein